MFIYHLWAQWQSSESCSQEIPQLSITEISLKITYLKFQISPGKMSQTRRYTHRSNSTWRTEMTLRIHKRYPLPRYLIKWYYSTSAMISRQLFQMYDFYWPSLYSVALSRQVWFQWPRVHSWLTSGNEKLGNTQQVAITVCSCYLSPGRTRL